ncbi:MAG: ABC transporter substrate-binding protein [Actinobacteria bacterium]|nr:ABC transporter substrate-binding protein [Actinomycetota bacterium]
MLTTSHRLRRTRVRCAVFALAALAAACSTTDDDSSTATAAVTAASASDTTAAANTTPAPETTVPPAENGPGVTDTEIFIGVETNEKSQAAQNATTGVQVREVGAQVQILVDGINAGGGINGRTITLVKADFDPAAETGAQENAACNTFTKDNEVFAVLGLRTDASEAYLSCLAEADTLYIAGSPTQPADEQLLTAAANLWAPQTMVLDEFAAAYVAALDDSGFFADATLGVVVSADNPIFQRVYEATLVPALEAVGVTPAYVASVPDSFERAMEVVPTELLKMQEAGVNKVLALEPNGIGIGVTVLIGSSQGLVLVPAMSTFDTPEPVRATLPPGSLAGVVGFAFGSPVEENQVANLNATATECLDVLTAAGEEIADGNARGVSFISCANTWFLRDVLAAVPGEVNGESFAAAAESLGAEYESAWGSLDLTVGHRTGQHLLQPFTLDPACDCFAYSTDLRDTRS